MSTIARSELILGGQKSGKSRRAETLAQQWLAADASHKAVFIATAQPWDDEMRQRIACHQADRAQRVPGMITVEEPLHLAQAIALHSRADTLVVVDCLTLWLTNCLMPVSSSVSAPPPMSSTPLSADDFKQKRPVAPEEYAQAAPFFIALSKAMEIAIAQAPGPLVLVGNEIGLGVIPLGREVRAFVDALGQLNQQVAAVCQRVTLMVAGLPLVLKDVP